MSNEHQPYNLKQIFKLLDLAFDDPQLNTFCLLHFTRIYDQFSRGMRKDEKITRLLDHCRRDETRCEQLLALVEGQDPLIFKKLEPFLRSASHNPAVVSKVISHTTLSSLFEELAEWKIIHNDVQELLNHLNMPLDYLTSYRIKSDPHMLQQAGYSWQKYCVRKLKLTAGKWEFQYAYTPQFAFWQEQMANIDQITRKLMGEVNQSEFDWLFSQFNSIWGILWEILTAADKRIMLLINDATGRQENIK